jgi:hypothetical protein
VARIPDGNGLCAVVWDEDGQEVFVPLELHADQPIATELRQYSDNQGHVTLRLAYHRQPIGGVRIALPPRPRGEPVRVWMAQETPGRIEIELEHEGTRVKRVLEFDPYE